MFKDIFSELLKTKGVTAYKLAKETGISNGNISEYKNGAKVPKADTLQKIADYFEVSTDYLLGREMQYDKLHIPDTLKDVRIAFNRGEFEGLTQDEVDKLAVIAAEFKELRKN